MEISFTQLHALLKDTSELGALKVLTKLGYQKDIISMAEANRRYGKQNVKYWTEQGLVTRSRDKSGSFNWRYSVIELETAKKAMNRFSHIEI